MAKHRAKQKESAAETRHPAVSSEKSLFAGFFQRYQRELLISLLLVISCLVIYGQSINYPFINYDDDAYVFNNPVVQSGVNGNSLRWAFTTFTMGHWHPLTWISYLLDTQLFGLNPTAFHFTGVLLHIINTVLVFLLLKYLTASNWRSSIVALLFAIHPLHVEPVVWISGRKDLLCTLFGLLSIIAYTRYVKDRSWSCYLLSIFLFLLGLMSKSMLITLPALLLLVDYWPLNRFAGVLKGETSLFTTSTRLILEKLPFFALSAGSAFMALKSQYAGLAVVATAAKPDSWQLLSSKPLILSAMTVKAYLTYLFKMVFPLDLGLYYPYDHYYFLIPMVIYALLLLAITVFAASRYRRQPYLIVGWLWYLAMIFPVARLVQADRYTYMSLIGIFIIIIWGINELAAHWQQRAQNLAYAGGVVLALLGVIAFFQVQQWRDTVTILEHTLISTENNLFMYYNLGNEMDRLGRLNEAAKYYQEALKLNPNYAMAYHNLSAVLIKQGKYEQAAENSRKALALQADYPEGRYNLGKIYIQLNRLDEAIEQLREAVRLKPDFVEAYNNLGGALFTSGRLDEAVDALNTALRLNPSNPEAHFNLGGIAYNRGRLDEATSQYNQTLQLNPNFAEAHYFLGGILFSQGKTSEAERQFNEALRLKPDFAPARASLDQLKAAEKK